MFYLKDISKGFLLYDCLFNFVTLSKELINFVKISLNLIKFRLINSYSSSSFMVSGFNSYIYGNEFYVHNFSNGLISVGDCGMIIKNSFISETIKGNTNQDYGYSCIEISEFKTEKCIMISNITFLNLSSFRNGSVKLN